MLVWALGQILPFSLIEWVFGSRLAANTTSYISELWLKIFNNRKIVHFYVLASTSNWVNLYQLNVYCNKFKLEHPQMIESHLKIA